MGSQDWVLVSNWFFVLQVPTGCELIMVFKHSFAGTGLVSVVVAWFVLPEVARRTPAEIDEM